ELRPEHKDKSSPIPLADESLLVPLLQSLPAIKINITTGFPLTQSPLFGMLDLWMKVHEQISHFKKDKIPFQELESFLNNPLTKEATFEREKNQANIIEQQLFEVAIDDITISTSALPHFFRPLSSSRDVIPALLHMLDTILVSAAQDSPIKQIEANLLIETKKVLHQLQLGFDRMPSLSVLFQIGLIRKAIAPVNAAIEGDPLDGLQIMVLLESRCLNFDQVYISGANEGILPATSSTATFLPNNLRKAYGLPVLE